MQFKRAFFLSSASTIHHGASGMCVRSNIISLALVYCSQRALDWTSMGLSFHCLSDVALKIPLGSFALAGSRQRRDPADPRIEALRDPFDDPTLSRRVAALEDDHDLQLVVHDPVLQFH